MWAWWQRRSRNMSARRRYPCIQWQQLNQTRQSFIPHQRVALLDRYVRYTQAPRWMPIRSSLNPRIPSVERRNGPATLIFRYLNTHIRTLTISSIVASKDDRNKYPEAFYMDLIYALLNCRRVQTTSSLLPWCLALWWSFAWPIGAVPAIHIFAPLIAEVPETYKNVRFHKFDVSKVHDVTPALVVRACRQYWSMRENHGHAASWVRFWNLYLSTPPTATSDLNTFSKSYT